MIHKRKISNDIVNMILASFIAFSFIYGKITSLMFEYKPLILYFSICGLLLVFYFIFYNKITLIITCSLSALLLVIAGIYIITSCSVSKIYLESISFSSWIMNYIEDLTAVNPVYRLYLTIGICILVTLFVFYITVKKFNFFLILTYGSVFFIVQWCFKYLVSYTPFYIFIILIIICYFKHIYNIKSTELSDYISQPKFIAWAVPISAIILVIALIIPSSYGSGKTNWVDGVFNSVYSFFSNTFNGYKAFEYFSLDSTGFNESNHRLGGKVRINKTLVLKVDSPRVTYFKGSCKEIYTGSSWENIKKDLSPIILDNGISNIDFYEMNTGTQLITDDLDFLNKYYFNDKIKITYENLMTKSLFVTSKFTNLSVMKPKSNKGLMNGYISQDGIITSKNVLGKNFNYVMDVYNPKYSDNNFKNLLRKSKAGFYEDLLKKLSVINKEIETINHDPSAKTAVSPDPVAEKTVLNYSYNITYPDLNFIYNNSIKADGSFPIPPDLFEKIKELNTRDYNIVANYNQIGNISPDDLNQLSNIAYNNYKDYLQLPKSVPMRVRELAKSISSTSYNTYDKVKSIENYLSTKYPYTLTPTSTPLGRDFVDYFLFDQKEGYCVYYASAMAVMVRSLGIPARYVEGYVLPATTDKNGIYNVTNQQAHAWVEVYLEGFGWIPFEPTSPYVSAFYNNKTKSYVSSSFASDPKFQEYLNNLNQYTNPSLGNQALNEKNSKSRKLPVLLVLTIIPCLLIVFLLVVMFNKLKISLENHRYKIMPPREKVINLYSKYVQMLTTLKLPLKPGETALEYAHRIDVFLLMSKPYNFKLVSSIFTSIRYSNKNIPSDIDSDYIYDFKRHIESRIRREYGILKYFLLRYVLGKI